MFEFYIQNKVLSIVVDFEGIISTSDPEVAIANALTLSPPWNFNQINFYWLGRLNWIPKLTEILSNYERRLHHIYCPEIVVNILRDFCSEEELILLKNVLCRMAKVPITLYTMGEGLNHDLLEV